MVALALTWYGLIHMQGSGGKDQAPVYVTAKVMSEPLTAKITCAGNLKPLVEVQVGSQVSGVIKDLYADYESRVEKGELIALIDPATFQAKVNRARADLEAARAELRKSRVTLTQEQRNLDRREKLLDRGAISRSEYDVAETKALAAEAQVGVDKAKTIQAEAKLKEALLNLGYTRITTPVSGVVISRSVDVGQTVAASFQAPVLFTIAEDLKVMQVYTNVDEADIGRVRVGQEAVFMVPAYMDKVFKASVSQIRNEPKIEQNVVTYNVVLDVSNRDLLLRPGMSAHVSIIVGGVAQALTVPAQALRFKPPADQAESLDEPASKEPLNEQRIWRIDEDGDPAPVTVRVGLRTPDKVQVISDDLKPGDTIALDEKMTNKGRGKRRGLRFGF